MALAGKKATLFSYSSPIVFTTEATTTSDNTTYQITDTNKRIWCKECTITVLDGGIPTVEVYTLNRLEGAVTFGSSSIRTITLTGQYLAENDELQAFEYTYTLEATNEDSTIFESEFVNRTQTLKDITASITRFYEETQYFLNNLLDDTDLVVKFYSQAAQLPDIKAWVKMASTEDSAAVDGLVEESIDLEGSPDIDKRSVSFGL